MKNGKVECINTTTTGVIGDTCTFSCYDGFELQGSMIKECEPTGNWEGGNPMCVAGQLVVTHICKVNNETTVKH